MQRFLVCLVLAAVVALTLTALPASASAKAKPYAKDFEAFTKHVGKTYPFFDLKKIRKEWTRAKKELAKRAKACKTDEDFMWIVYDAVKCLRDSHMTVRPRDGLRLEWPKRWCPGLGLLPAADGQVIVMHAPRGRETTLPAGTIVTEIDGQPAREFLDERAEAEWAAGGYFSSPQRARLFVYRTALAGEKSEKHTLEYLDGKKRKTITLRSETQVSGWAHTYNLPKGLVGVGRSFSHTQLENGVGYMYWRRIDESIWQGIPQALEAHGDAKGWIVDVRGNSGGGYDRTLTDLIKGLPRPVAVITDAGCISAGETVIRDLVELADARVFGTTSAGASSSKKSWSFPSGIASIVYSTRSRRGVGGKLIEFNGVEPHVTVEPVPAEVLAGRNSEILRAEEFVLESAK